MLLIQGKGLWSIVLGKAFELDSSLCHRMSLSLLHTNVHRQSPRATCNVFHPELLTKTRHGISALFPGKREPDTQGPSRRGTRLHRVDAAEAPTWRDPVEPEAQPRSPGAVPWRGCRPGPAAWFPRGWPGLSKCRRRQVRGNNLQRNPKSAED